MATPTTTAPNSYTAVIYEYQEFRHSISSFCNGEEHVLGWNVKQTAVVLALAHCSGWSADCIAVKIGILFHNRPLAEDIFDLYWRWIMKHPRADDGVLPEAEDELIDTILRAVGINLTKKERSLNMTIRPQTIRFLKIWDPKRYNNKAICDGYDEACRESSKLFLGTQNLSDFAKLTEYEKPVVEQFGPLIKTMIKDVLKQWLPGMMSKLRADGIYRSLKDQDHLQLALSYINKFSGMFAAKYGTMEQLCPKDRNGMTRIQSTGACAMTILSFMIADRISTTKKIQAWERQTVCFLIPEVQDLALDEKCCAICMEEMGVSDHEGKVEEPIQLIICCGQILGSNCLKEWLNNDPYYPEEFRNSCPTCRYEFPSRFLQKLFDIKDEVYDDEQHSEEEVYADDHYDDEQYDDEQHGDEQPDDDNDDDDDDDANQYDNEQAEVDSNTRMDMVFNVTVLNLNTSAPSHQLQATLTGLGVPQGQIQVQEHVIIDRRAMPPRAHHLLSHPPAPLSPHPPRVSAYRSWNTSLPGTTAPSTAPWNGDGVVLLHPDQQAHPSSIFHPGAAGSSMAGPGDSVATDDEFMMEG